METLQWNESILIDESIQKIDTHDYEPQIGTDLNNEHNDIKIMIQNQDQFLNPSESSIYIEGSLTTDTDTQFDFKTKAISIINNGLMYMFDRVSYRIGNEEIEGYSYPGIASTLKGLLTYQRDSKENMLFLWSIDTIKNTNSSGFKERLEYISSGKGNFSALIPLKHIFGFCENYKKVIYGVKHTLILRRGNDSNALLKADDANNPVEDGKLTIKKLIWKMPCYKLSDEYQFKMLKQIQNKTSIPIAYLNRQLEQTVVNRGQKFLDWTLTPSSGVQRPRYIILGFQTDKDRNQLSNNGLFDNCDLQNAYVQLNNERYPENNLQLNFSGNVYATAYKMLKDYISHENCAIEYKDYKDLHPIIVFDVSRQNERIKNTTIDVKIKAEFGTNIPDNTYAYALILSDRVINLQSDGNKMNMIY